MGTIDVLLSGRLKLSGYGQSLAANGDGTVRMALAEGETVREVVQNLGVPSSQVAMTMVNARQCPSGTVLNPGDRLILIPPDVAALWRFLGLQNLGAESIFDF